jgi:hypothetical protein
MCGTQSVFLDAEIDLETKARALAKCDVGQADSEPATKWSKDRDLMAFLRSL